MAHDPRIVRNEDQIEALRKTIPDLDQESGTAGHAVHRAGLRAARRHPRGRHRAVFVAQPYIGTKLAEFGAEVIHVERPGGDTFRFTAPHLTRGPRPHGCDEAEVIKNKLSLGLDFKHARGIELLMALWKISDVWMESSIPGTLERAASPTSWRSRSIPAS